MPRQKDWKPCPACRKAACRTARCSSLSGLSKYPLSIQRANLRLPRLPPLSLTPVPRARPFSPLTVTPIESRTWHPILPQLISCVYMGVSLRTFHNFKSVSACVFGATFGGGDTFGWGEVASACTSRKVASVPVPYCIPLVYYNRERACSRSLPPGSEVGKALVVTNSFGRQAGTQLSATCNTLAVVVEGMPATHITRQGCMPPYRTAALAVAHASLLERRRLSRSR